MSSNLSQKLNLDSLSSDEREVIFGLLPLRHCLVVGSWLTACSEGPGGELAEGGNMLVIGH